jgi:cytochrome c553
MKNFVLSLAFISALALTGCSDQEKQGAADVSAGKALAEQECKGCHGLDGKGAAPGIPNLAGQEERYLIEALNEYRDGKRTHAALREVTAKMSAAQARNVAAYYASLPPISPASDVETFSPYENGKKRAAACMPCHGEDGNSKTPGTPSLAGQQARYLVIAIQEYLTGARAHEPAPMHSLVRDMDHLDLETIALFFASQTPAERAAPPFGDPKAGEPLSAPCGGCHGSHGVSSNASTPTLAAQDGRYLVEATKAYRQKTRRDAAMNRAVAGLSDADIENLAAYYAVQKSRPAEQGQMLVQELTEKCNRCHGADVKNAAMAIPNIRGQDKDYLIMALEAYRDDKRESSVMHKMSLPYADAVIEAIASFYATRPAK